MAEPLPAGSTIGILGGGQLGRMLALAAARLGLKTHIFCPDPESPAFEVTPHRTVAAYDHEVALAAFAGAVDVVTYEFENVPAATAAFLAARRPLAPGARALEVAQDRLIEKRFLAEHGIAIAPFAPVTDRTELERAIASVGLPAMLKTTRFGYDGKGQIRLGPDADIRSLADSLDDAPRVLEGFVDFSCEISVIVARSVDGTVSAYDPAENAHRDQILHTSTVPAAVAPDVARRAVETAGRIAGALGYVGVLGVEFFVTQNEALLVNEIAPRVHNSGHWTEAVCVTDQFEQHIRAVAGWPLGDATRLADVTMENLIGDAIGRIPGDAGANARVHNYGKAEARPGRKMGHINHVRPLTGSR